VSSLEVADGVVAAATAAATLAAMVAALWWCDRSERDPLLWLGAATVGGTVTGFMAAVAGASLAASGRGVSAGWSLELVDLGPRWLVQVLVVSLTVALARQLDSPTDALIYGTAVGAGVGIGVSLHGTVFAAGPVLGPVNEVLLHCLSGATLGGCLGGARFTGRWPARLGYVAGGLGLSAGVHLLAPLLRGVVHSGLASGGLAPGLVMLATCAGLLLCSVALVLRAEQRTLSSRLGEEVALGVLPRWVVDVVPFYRRRVRSAWWPRRDERTLLTRRLTRLAYRKQALGDLAPEQLEGLELVRLRQRLRTMLESPAADSLQSRDTG
jgi:hypothetical protein